MRAKKMLGAVTALAVAGLVTGITTSAAEAAQTPHATHGLGYKLGSHAPVSHTAKPVLRKARAANDVPASFDLTQYAIAPGDQGQVGSCVAWATVHSGYGILMNEQGITGGPMAPMFIYAQIAKGNDQGTNGIVAIPMEQDQGVDTASDYTQGDFDDTTQPTDAERDNAAQYKLSGYNTLSTGDGLKVDIESSISQGMPVAIGLPVHDSFMNITKDQAADYSYMPGDDSADPVAGGHELAVVGYTDQGVTIENSWGTSWGNDGYVNVPWDFVTSQVEDAIAMGELVK